MRIYKSTSFYKLRDLLVLVIYAPIIHDLFSHDLEL